MLNFKLTILSALLFICHGYCQNATSPKCRFTDSKCVRGYFTNLARTRASTGMMEIGLPPVDPYKLFNIVVSALDLLKLTLVEGECIGIGRTCRVLKYETDLKHMNRTIEIICDRIVIQGIYTIRSHPALCYMLGAEAYGNGYGTILLEDWFFEFKYNFELVEHKNGQIHVQPDFETAKWVSDVRKKATITANNIMLGHRNITYFVVQFINNSWKLIFRTLAYWFHKISVDYYFLIYKVIFANIPTSAYTDDDLTPYLLCNRECY